MARQQVYGSWCYILPSVYGPVHIIKTILQNTFISRDSVVSWAMNALWSFFFIPLLGAVEQLNCMLSEINQLQEANSVGIMVAVIPVLGRLRQRIGSWRTAWIM